MNTAPDRLKLALAQMNPTVGDLAGNALAIVRTAQEAAAHGADLVLFPEMALTGYPPEDLILVPAFRQAAWDAARQIAKDTQSLPCDLIFGNLWEEGAAIYNASVLASGGRLSLLRAKHALPNYGVFDEMRVFAPGPEPEVVEWRGLKLGLLICEEVWQPGAGVALAQAGAELLLVQNASPYHIGKASERKAVVDAVVKATGLPLVYLNLVGGQDELVFDGRSYAVGADGADAARLPAFCESLAVLEWKKTEGGLAPHASLPPAASGSRSDGATQGSASRWVCVSGPMEPVRGDEETIYHALVLGLRDYVRKNGFPGVVLGLSGGIDSALSAAIAVDALGADKVLGLRLPSPYSSADSLEDAQALVELLGMQTHTVSIEPGMQAANAALAPLFAGRAPDTTEENIQARLRGLTLMAMSNKFGHMLLTTGNKSEMSVGYATLYGDMAGGFSVLKDVYKTTVTRLSSWRNGFADIARLGLLGPAGPVMPERSITKPPSAELRPGQLDQDSLPPYAVLDTVLRGLIERQLSVHELIAEGMEPAVVEKVAKLVWAAEYKRRQSAPGVKITPMAFGRDRRWPITNRWKFQ
ncbi:MAG: NAD+ synthase [Azospirillum brasilense]|nr:MAG: NAD+ synthase [Azospirillum brasilense]